MVREARALSRLCPLNSKGDCKTFFSVLFQAFDWFPFCNSPIKGQSLVPVGLSSSCSFPYNVFISDSFLRAATPTESRYNAKFPASILSGGDVVETICRLKDSFSVRISKTTRQKLAEPNGNFPWVPRRFPEIVRIANRSRHQNHGKPFPVGTR